MDAIIRRHIYIAFLWPCGRCEHIRVFAALIPHRRVKIALLNNLGLVQATYPAGDVEIGDQEAVRAVSKYGDVTAVKGSTDGVVGKK